MAIPRSQQIDLKSTPYYHCISRCIRQHYLCGVDRLTQKDYSHRKRWLIKQFHFLANIFAIKICAYAVMSNHYHLVLFVDQDFVNQWSDDEVRERWGALFPKNAKEFGHKSSKISEWREKLSSISWFMRCVNEPLARNANKEDKVTGRFWEGRFKSQALLDEGALIGAMAYVDLNPIRAGIALTPETSEFTSIYERIQLIKDWGENLNENQTENQSAEKAVNSNKFTKINSEKLISQRKIEQPTTLMPFSENLFHFPCKEQAIGVSLLEYLDLLDYTGRQLKDDKRGAIPEKLSPILDRLKIKTHGWFSLVKNVERHFFQAIGNEHYMMLFAGKRSRKPKGITICKQIYKSACA